jgi:hypothetical protein
LRQRTCQFARHDADGRAKNRQRIGDVIDTLIWIRRIHPNAREHEVNSMEVIVKSMLFILLAQLHAGGTQTVAVYQSLEQCRDALKVVATNVAADYTCAATPVEGRWSQKDSRYLMVRE